jgi:hypothetical protein
MVSSLFPYKSSSKRVKELEGLSCLAAKNFQKFKIKIKKLKNIRCSVDELIHGTSLRPIYVYWGPSIT